MDVDVDEDSVLTSETSRESEVVWQHHEHGSQVIVDSPVPFPIWTILDVLGIVLLGTLRRVLQCPMKYARGKHSLGQ
jgi:hypothetical protein